MLRPRHSRSEATATSLAQSAKASPDVYFATPSSSSNTLDALLAREDIHAVVIALPITSQPEYIKKALSAGKHVLSEKPIAKDVKEAKALLEWYEGLGENRPVWGIAENFRFWETVVFAGDKIRELGGEVVSFGFEMFKDVPDEDKYFNTACTSLVPSQLSHFDPLSPGSALHPPFFTSSYAR